jgi:hypothetical protein
MCMCAPVRACVSARALVCVVGERGGGMGVDGWGV